jgi:hypothetical protein
VELPLGADPKQDRVRGLQGGFERPSKKRLGFSGWRRGADFLTSAYHSGTSTLGESKARRYTWPAENIERGIRSDNSVSFYRYSFANRMDFESIKSTEAFILGVRVLGF